MNLHFREAKWHIGIFLLCEMCPKNISCVNFQLFLSFLFPSMSGALAELLTEYSILVLFGELRKKSCCSIISPLKKLNWLNVHCEFLFSFWFSSC